MTNTMQALGTAAGVQVLFVSSPATSRTTVQGAPIFADPATSIAFVASAAFALVAFVAALAVPYRRSARRPNHPQLVWRQRNAAATPALMRP